MSMHAGPYTTQGNPGYPESSPETMKGVRKGTERRWSKMTTTERAVELTGDVRNILQQIGALMGWPSTGDDCESIFARFGELDAMESYDARQRREREETAGAKKEV